MKQALIVQGGWDGHYPRETSVILAEALRGAGFQVEVADTLDALRDGERLKELSLIVPHWTMGRIEGEQLGPLLEAVSSGVGLAGIHGGMGDAFREQTEYQFACGGQFVAHPGGLISYAVHIEDAPSPITEGLSDFEVTSEQYYMHVDPSLNVLATTVFAGVGPQPVVMPVTWTKGYGEGRVFYCSLGHSPDVLELPPVLTMVTRGMAWAAR
jgi:type 1 glutamine amidotransferase